MRINSPDIPHKYLDLNEEKKLKLKSFSIILNCNKKVINGNQDPKPALFHMKFKDPDPHGQDPYHLI